MTVTPEQKAEIDNARAQSATTRRVTAPGLEEILYDAIPILDHGFIRVIDYMGDDSSIVQAARVSYGRGTKKVNEDKGLIDYLIRHRHTTPFEMCEIKYHVKLPIFVARQWIRHRTANVNEYSARYSMMDREFYIPDPSQLAAQSTENHQGRGHVLEGEEAAYVLDILKKDAEHNFSSYEDMLNQDSSGNQKDPNRQGLARELARMNLTLNTYTQWYWKIDLHNLLHFLSLRAEGHAQYEIRVYADAMLETVKRWVPLAHDAFMRYRMGGTHLSAGGLEAVKALIAGKKPSREQFNLSAREWRELMASLGLEDQA
jgi:thymidylate synthase (FAD)